MKLIERRARHGPPLRSAVFAVFMTGAVLLISGCGSGGGETTPPAKPTGLAATAGDGQVTLNWNGDEERVAHYNVYKGTSSQDLAQETEVPKGTQQYVATGLSNGTTYHFAVDAESSGGAKSQMSTEVTATPSDAGGSGGRASCQFDDAASTFGSCSFGN